MENEDTDNELPSIYATLYRRDYYVQMNNNEFGVGKIKERSHDKLVRKEAFYAKTLLKRYPQ